MRRLLALALAFATTASAHAATNPALDKVLRQLDDSAAKFQSAEADLKWELYEKIVRDTSTQYGSIYFIKSNAALETGAILTTQPDKKQILKYLHFANGKGELYDTVAKKATPFNAGENRGRVESFLALGFGGSGTDIEKNWTVTLEGNETIDGTPTAKLDLVPKDPSTAESVKRVTMWIDPTRDVPLKQIMLMPEGDTRTSYYTNIRLNQKVDTKKYKH